MGECMTIFGGNKIENGGRMVGVRRVSVSELNKVWKNGHTGQVCEMLRGGDVESVVEREKFRYTAKE